MAPLSEDNVGKGPDQAAGHRDFFRVGNAINPDRTGSEEFAEDDAKETRSRAGRQHDIRSNAKNDPQDFQDRLQHQEGRVSIRILDWEESSRLDLIGELWIGRDPEHVVAFECRSEALKLDPVTAPGRDGQNTGWVPARDG
jgi:hypothetical protein